MAFGEFTFSREGRVRLAGVLRALLIVQLVVSLCMAIFCYNTCMRVLQLLKHIQKVTVYLLYVLILMQAYCLKLHYTSGLRLMSWFVRTPYWPRAMTSSAIWMISGTCVALNGILVYVAVKATLKALVKELNTSLRIGISVYLVEPRWKILLDTIQIEMGCCGADKPKDWHEIPWINLNFLNEYSDVVMRQSEWKEVWLDGSPLVTASLHARGCIEAIKAPLGKAVLALQLLSSLVVIIQVMIVIVSQLIRSSWRDAALRGDCDGDGRAALIGVPKPYMDTISEEAEAALGRRESEVMTQRVRRHHRRRRRGTEHTTYTYLS